MNEFESFKIKQVEFTQLFYGDVLYNIGIYIWKIN